MNGKAQCQEQEASSSHYSRKQKGNRNWGHASKPSKSTNNNLLPSARLHLLKILLPSQIAPPAGNQVFKHMSLCGTFHIHTTSDVLKSKLLGLKIQIPFGLVSFFCFAYCVF